MDYFELLPDIMYQGVHIKDISISLAIKGIDNYLEDYQLKDDEDVYDVAFNLYGKDELFWLIYVVNPEFPFYKIKSTAVFSEYLSNRYKGSGIELRGIDKTYKNIIVKKSNTIIEIDMIDRTRNQIFLKEYLDGGSDIIIDIIYQDKTISLPIDNISSIFYNKSRYMPAYYEYNGEKYINKPFDNSDVITWEEYEISKNEKKRVIKVIPQKHVDAVISEIINFINKVKK